MSINKKLKDGLDNPESTDSAGESDLCSGVSAVELAGDDRFDITELLHDFSSMACAMRNDNSDGNDGGNNNKPSVLKGQLPLFPKASPNYSGVIQKPDRILVEANDGTISFIDVENTVGTEDHQNRILSDDFPYRSVEEFRVIQQTRKLLEEGSLWSESKALKLLEDSGLVAHLCYDEIHTQGFHEFSNKNSRHTNFAAEYANLTRMNSDSLVVELGSGFGRDVKYYAIETGARIISIDSSKVASRAVLGISKEIGLSDRIDVRCSDFRNILSNFDHGITHVCGNSVFHYFPPQVLKNNILPRIREMLVDTNGWFGMSIKTIESDSAKNERHYRLTRKSGGFNASLDKRDRIFRIYPEKSKILELVRASGFHVVHAYEEDVPDYDMEGEVEKFLVIIAQPVNKI